MIDEHFGISIVELLVSQNFYFVKPDFNFSSAQEWWFSLTTPPDLRKTSSLARVNSSESSAKMKPIWMN